MTLFNEISVLDNKPEETRGPHHALELLRLIRLIIDDVESLGGAETVLRSEADAVSYTFTAKTGATAKGRVRPELREPLLVFLDVASCAQCFSSPTLDDGPPPFTVTREAETNEFRLTWGKDEKRPARNSDVIPFTLHRQAPATRGNQPARRRSSSEKWVVVVEENEAFAQVLSRFLKRQGLSATFARNEEEMRALLKKETGKSPAFLLCDLPASDLVDAELMKRLQAEERLRGIPVLILSSDESIETKIKAITSGAEAFISKTEDPRLLSAHISRILSRRNDEEEE